MIYIREMEGWRFSSTTDNMGIYNKDARRMMRSSERVIDARVDDRSRAYDACPSIVDP